MSEKQSRARERIRLGIIGCGKVAHHRHVPALNLIPRFQIVAASDTQADRLDRFAREYNVPQRYPDYHELLENPDIDAVAVLTHTGAHAEIGLAAMEAGKHLFMEKPLALTLEDCERLIEKSNAAPTKSLLCFNLRRHRLIQRAREELRTGKMGQIRAIRSVYTHLRDGSQAPSWHRVLDLGGGVTFNEAVHHFDLWYYLLGQEVTHISAFHTPDDYYEDESSVITAKFENGMLGSMYNTFRTSPNNEVEIYGESGRLYLNLYKFDGLDFFPAEKYPGNIPNRMKKLVQSGWDFLRYLPILRRGGGFPDTFYQTWQHFADCVLHGQTPGCTFEDGKRALKIALATIESFNSQSVVTVNG